MYVHVLERWLAIANSLVGTKLVVDPPLLTMNEATTGRTRSCCKPTRPWEHTITVLHWPISELKNTQLATTGDSITRSRVLCGTTAPADGLRGAWPLADPRLLEFCTGNQFCSPRPSVFFAV